MRRMKPRRGAMLVVIALMLIVFVAMAAFCVDVAYMQLTSTRLRTATDAAARAGGATLSSKQDLNAARSAAKELAASNHVSGKPLEVADEDVVFGRAIRELGGKWQFAPGVKPINGVQVTGRRTAGSISGSVPLFLGQLLGTRSFQPSTTALSVLIDRDICLVVDRSSSMKLDLASTAQTMSTSDPRFKRPPNMSDSRWGALAFAVQAFVLALEDTSQDERVGLASFSSDYSAFRVVNKKASTDQILTSNPGLVAAAMQAFSISIFNGATNSAAGIDEGIRVLTDPTTSRPYALKTMVYMTDGYRTEGGDPIVSARNAAAKGIVIHTITFGAIFDQSEMITVANVTGGKYYHAPDAAPLTSIFQEIALTLPVVLAQ